MTQPFKDPVELIVENALKAKGIRFIPQNEPGNKTKGLDFYLPLYDTYIECKQFHTVRSNEQLKRAERVILIQGMGAALCFAEMLNMEPIKE
jgi:hypothetical protein